MSLIFRKLPVRGQVPDQGNNMAFLLPDNWDDYHFKTLFSLIVFDADGNKYELGNIKIGFVGQHDGWTNEQIQDEFEVLPENFFSLGQDADFYQLLVQSLSDEVVFNILQSLRDVVYASDLLEMVENEEVFRISLLRTVNRTSIEHQFKRIINNEVPLTDYDFFYEKDANSHYSGIKVEFKVKPGSKPPSNIHILIGRNGVGKTTLLNNMVNALLPERGTVEETGHFATPSTWGSPYALGDDYFAGVVSVSFSAFDPFLPPDDQPDPNLGLRYHYIGLKKRLSQAGQSIWGLKNQDDLRNDFIESAKVCIALSAKRKRWEKAIRKLESDSNFSVMNLTQLIDIFDNDSSPERRVFSSAAYSLFKRMSSGHAIVLLTITKLVETVEEKTLVLLDEPESHLHPPLLSAFIRALSDLLVNRNGIAIIATHSPVVLQEVPKSCVSILRRTRLVANVDRPGEETFGENVGVLTREVFGLEVSKSGFYDLLESSVAEGNSYDDIVAEYGDQIGFEGKILLRSKITLRDQPQGTEE